MIRYTRDGLPILDPAWQQDELSDRGESEEWEEDESDEVPFDDHLEADYEDRVSGPVDDADPTDGSTPPW